MIKHLVLFRFREDAGSAAIDAIIAGLNGLPALIADIRSFQVGRDILRSERSYDLALVSDFVDLAALERYQVHPEHQKVVALVKQAASSVVAVDYEY